MPSVTFPTITRAATGMAALLFSGSVIAFPITGVWTLIALWYDPSIDWLAFWTKLHRVIVLVIFCVVLVQEATTLMMRIYLNDLGQPAHGYEEGQVIRGITGLAVHPFVNGLRAAAGWLSIRKTNL